MKNDKKYYIVAWLIAVVIFHVIMFLIPTEILSREENRFWIIYVTIFVSLIGQAVCSLIYANKRNKKERFLYLPVIIIGYIALLVMLLLALQAVTLAFLPDWFTIIIAVLVLGYYALAVIRTMAAADMILEVEKKVERKTEFIKMLSAKAGALVQGAPAEVQLQTKKVYEALRYSDPMSCGELSSVEIDIEKQFDEFATAVRENNKEKAENLTSVLCGLIKERNELCKQFK